MPLLRGWALPEAHNCSAMTKCGLWAVDGREINEDGDQVHTSMFHFWRHSPRRGVVAGWDEHFSSGMCEWKLMSATAPKFPDGLPPSTSEAWMHHSGDPTRIEGPPQVVIALLAAADGKGESLPENSVAGVGFYGTAALLKFYEFPNGSRLALDLTDNDVHGTWIHQSIATHCGGRPLWGNVEVTNSTTHLFEKSPSGDISCTPVYILP